jgi:hypothetical protein
MDPDPGGPITMRIPNTGLPGQLCVWRGLVPHSQVVADHQVTRSANNTPDIKTFKKSKDRGEKICFPTVFCSYKYHKIENNFNFELAKKKNLG